MSSARQTGSAPGSARILSPLQRAWLAEIGVDRVLLSHFAPTRVPDGLKRPPLPAQGVHDAAASSPADARLAGGRPASVPALDHVRALVGAVQRDARRPADPVPAVPARPVRSEDDIDIDETADLALLEAHARDCRACGLHAQRARVVFAAGDADTPDWMIIGEAPGRADEPAGMPFQGEPGQLLHAMLTALGIHPASASLGSEAVVKAPWSQPATMYLTNLVKCRPLNNRSPEPQELAACRGFLDRQIIAVRPRRLLALGRLAAQVLLAEDRPLEELRGRVHRFEPQPGLQIPLVATWHPATLLLQPGYKPLVWQDLQLARSIVA